eukprot:5059442-Alexandrium_andersonii.AAC.1
MLGPLGVLRLLRPPEVGDVLDHSIVHHHLRLGVQLLRGLLGEALQLQLARYAVGREVLNRNKAVDPRNARAL